jgi:hypothetical protein
MKNTSIRVEPINNRHPAWSDVLAAIFRTGSRESVLISEDGWLSSRQTVLAAFDGDNVVGHLCFRIEPQRTQGRAIVHSRVDSFAVEGTHAHHAVDKLLLDHADLHARVMKCTPPQPMMVAC